MPTGRTSGICDMTYDLAVVGYGPTGMTLAALAGQSGHRVVVLEKHRGLYNLPRAACFDDEIMRTFQKLDLVEEILPGAVVQPTYEWVNGGGELLLELSYDNPAAAGWAALYMMFQPHIEAVLDRRCKSLPTVEVRQGVRVGGVEQDRDGVTIRGTDRDGANVQVRARYAVGCDGGSGFTRSAAEASMSDYGFQENWLVCDFRKHPGVDHVPTFRQVCDPRQPIAIVQIGPEHHRFSFMLDPEETVDQAVAAHRIWQRVAGYLKPDQAELIRVANYVFRSRIAERWRDGRLLLAGDAAHEMPPFLAQGMCSGMRDSHNLAWKLDLVLSGRGRDRVLDSYQAEREPHVRFITEKAIELGRVQTLRDPVAARERDARLIAQREAHTEPEKLQLPPLNGGLLSVGAGRPGAGDFFPQGRVRADGTVHLFDDVVGPGPCIVIQHASMLAEFTTSARERWAALGGRLALVEGAPGSDPPAHVAVVADVDGVYARWFGSHGRRAALVRPDWYVFGTAGDAHQLLEVVDEFATALTERKAA